MPDKGKRKVQSHGQITLPKDFREENDIEKGDYIKYRRHKRNNSELIIEPAEDEKEE